MALDAVTSGDDDDDEPSALEEAFHAYQDNGLRLPPIPRTLIDELDEFADWRWGSDDLNLEDRDGAIEAARAPGGEEAVAFGHIGHGVSSWWLCYRLNLPTIAIYIRLAYGGAYQGDDVVPGINAVYAQLEPLIPAAEAAYGAGRFSGGHRLLVVLDDKMGSFWEIAGGPGGEREADDPLGDAMQFLGEPVLLPAEDDNA